MWIVYRDELGTVVEDVDEYGVSFNDGTAYFNDKKVPMNEVLEIKE